MYKGMIAPLVPALAHWLALFSLNACWTSHPYVEFDPERSEPAEDADSGGEVPGDPDGAGEEAMDSTLDGMPDEDGVAQDLEDVQDEEETVQPTWVRVYELRMMSEGNALVPIPGEGYVAAGYNHFLNSELHVEDVWVLKLDLDGRVLWQNRYGRFDRPERAFDVALTDDVGYLVVGSAQSLVVDGGPGDMDFLALRLNAHGEVEWFKTYGGPDSDEAHAVARTLDGGYLLAGESGACRCILLINIDDAGNIVWAKSYDDVHSETAFDIEATLDGGYVMVGLATFYSPSPLPEDILIVKIDAHGNIVWQKIFNDTHCEDFAGDISATRDGGYLVAGMMNDSGPRERHGLVLKLDEDGEIQWQTFLGTNSTGTYAVREIEEGLIVAAGTDWLLEDAWIMALDEYGTILWRRDYRGEHMDTFKSLALAPDGGFAVLGYTSSFDIENRSFWVVKTNGAGGQEGPCRPELGESGSVEMLDQWGSLTEAHFQAADFDATVTTYDVITYATSATVTDGCAP